MPMDGLTIGATVYELNNLLNGGRIDKINQPEDDEIHILIRNNGENHKLLLCSNASFARLNISEITKTNPLVPSNFCMLLRKHLSGAKINRIEQIGNERIVIIYIDCINDFSEPITKKIILEIMGKHSNIIFVDENDKIFDSIKRVNSLMSRVRIVQPGTTYVLPPSQDKIDPFYASESEYISARFLNDKYIGISMQAAHEIIHRAGNNSNSFADYLALYKNKQFSPVLLTNAKNEPLDFFAVKQERFLESYQLECETISQAIDKYFVLKDRVQRLKERSHSIRTRLNNLLEKANKKKAQQLEKQIECSDVEKYRIYGELITANLYLIKKGATEVTVQNYYDNMNDITIPIDNKISPSANAQKYFKQYNKLKTALRLLTGQMAETDSEIEFLSQQLDNLEKCENEADIKEIRQELVDFGYIKTQKTKEKTVESKPMHFVSSAGIDIYVGKNNLQNDRLTMRFAKPTDLWLHAKDIHGSHVIVCSDSPDDNSTEEAALLAAFYSKAKKSSLVPVDATLKKYVKKPSGAIPGKVIYTNQTTYFVTPSEEKIKNIIKK